METAARLIEVEGDDGERMSCPFCSARIHPFALGRHIGEQHPERAPHDGESVEKNTTRKRKKWTWRKKTAEGEMVRCSECDFSTANVRRALKKHFNDFLRLD